MVLGWQTIGYTQGPECILWSLWYSGIGVADHRIHPRPRMYPMASYKGKTKCREMEMGSVIVTSYPFFYTSGCS